MSWDCAFHSGMSSDGDMRACIETGSAVGVVAGLLNIRHLIRALPAFLNQGGKVFVDSGAFTARRLNEVMVWDRVFFAYRCLINSTDHPENLTIVAPDIVGDQAGTIALWRQHRNLIREWIDSGARVVMPLQTGPLLAPELLQSAKEILGTAKFCVGIPSNLDAMTAEECSTIIHDDFHVLGRVRLNNEVKAKLDGIRARNPTATVTADANWLRSRIRKIKAFSTTPPTFQNGFMTRRTQAVIQLLKQEAY